MEHLWFKRSLTQVSAKTALDTWIYQSPVCIETPIIPDGCRDFIFKRTPNGTIHWLISPLDTTTTQVSINAGTDMVGVRLRPGTQINETALLKWSRCHDPLELLDVDRLDEFCTLRISTVEILDCLKGAASVGNAASELGVSVRTLQREVKQSTGTTPKFWLALARVRQTCRLLATCQDLAEASALFGYADQAHMTRDIRRWLGVTPIGFMANQELHQQLYQRGYG
ncbi:MAG: helix-turn-helix domain-containing protein [Cyanobacteria bacterium J06656_5]